MVAHPVSIEIIYSVFFQESSRCKQRHILRLQELKAIAVICQEMPCRTVEDFYSPGRIIHAEIRYLQIFAGAATLLVQPGEESSVKPVEYKDTPCNKV